MKKMKTNLIILTILIFSHCSKGQNWEDNICDCIEENYNIDNWNYFKELEVFEQELIDRNKVDETIESKLQLLVDLSEKEYVDFYKNYFSERLETFGRETVEYCTRRELFNKDCQEKHWSEKLIKLLRYHRQELIINRDRILYNQNVAKSTIETIKNVQGENKLKNLLILQVLYDRIPDESFYNLDQLEIEGIKKQKEYDEFDKTRIKEIHINQSNQILINSKQITLKDLCLNLEEALKLNFGLEIVIDKKANYKYFLDVNDMVGSCIDKKRDQDSVQLFGKQYSELTEKEVREFQIKHKYKLLKSRMK